MWISLLWFESSMQCRESYGEVQRQAYMSKVCLLAARHCWNGWNMYSQNKFSWWKELSISNSVFSNLGLLCLMFQSGVTSNDGKQTLELVCRSLEAGPLEYHVSMLGSTSNCWCWGLRSVGASFAHSCYETWLDYWCFLDWMNFKCRIDTVYMKLI